MSKYIFARVVVTLCARVCGWGGTRVNVCVRVRLCTCGTVCVRIREYVRVRV